MKIGIMTMQRIKNYGSFLQAYGLKKNLEELGCEVSFVDYHFEKSLVKEDRSLLRRFVKNRNPFSYLRKKRIQHQYDEAFERKFIPELCGEKYNYLPDDIEALIIGSDEVFNCLQPYPVGYSRELFGFGYEEISVSSYAASFGQTNYERLKAFGIENEVAEMLSSFKKISVRDRNSRNVIKDLLGKPPYEHLDPVLVTDYSSEIIDNVKLKDYIILYAYPERLTRDEAKAIKKFAKRHGKTIVGLGMYQKICDINIVVHPFEIFSYFEHADFVITDTFHGSIFSIKSHTNYCTIVRDSEEGNSNKLIDLLSKLKQSDRIVKDGNFTELYNKKVDFSGCDRIVSSEKQRTVEYLKSIVSLYE